MRELVQKQVTTDLDNALAEMPCLPPLPERIKVSAHIDRIDEYRVAR